jgi:hypothetical protein
MFETDNKKIKLIDRGIEKTFTIKMLFAVQALKLIREISLVLSDLELIKSIVLKQFISNMLQSGEKHEGVDNKELMELMQMDIPQIISLLIQSVIRGLDDKTLEILVDKFMVGVIFHSSPTLSYPGNEALQMNMILDFETVIALIKEVFTLNFSGVIERIKKFQDLKAIDKEQKNI